MNLYVMRHGKAEARGVEWPVDELRPLAPTGRRRTRDGAVGLRRLGVQPQRTLCSPLVRARQTAEIVHEGLKLERPIEFVDSLAGWRLSSIIADASMADVESVLLVGHEPTLSELIGLLIGGREASIRLRPGSIAMLNAPELQPGPCAELEWLLTPKQLAAIGRYPGQPREMPGCAPQDGPKRLPRCASNFLWRGLRPPDCRVDGLFFASVQRGTAA